MRTFKHALSALALALVLVSGCSEDGGAPLGGNNGPANPNAAELNEMIAALPGWQQPADFRNSQPVEQLTITQVDEPIPDYLCDIQEHDWARASNEVFAPEQDFADLWPGAIFHGANYKYGELEPLALPRSSITLFSNMPGSQSMTVSDPTSTSMTDAINKMRGDADPGAYQSEWEFRVEEVYSNKHSMMELGVNAGYGGQVGGALNFSENRTVTRHVVFGRAVQRMYTIRFDDSAKKSPADFFDPTVKASDLTDAGVGNGDLPVYVKSVTYGQMILFRAIVNIEGSSEQFKADFKAAWEGFTGGGSGGGGGTDLLKQATYEAVGYGGDPGNSGSAIGAVKDQDFGKFFDGATVQNAVPLFFEVYTVKDGEPADLGERVVYETWENCKGVKEYRFDLTWTRMRANGTVDWDRTYEVDLSCGLLPTPRGVMTVFRDFPAGNTWYNVNKSTYCTAKARPNEKIQVAYGVTGQLITSDGGRVEYPFRDLPRNQNWIECGSGGGCTPIEVHSTINPLSPIRQVRLEFRMRLTPIYE